MKWPLILAAAIGVAALIAFNMQAQPNEPPFVVNVKPAGDGCRVTVEGQEVSSDRLLQLGRAAASRRGIVVFQRETPFRCIGSAVFTLQRAGLANVEAAMWYGG